MKRFKNYFARKDAKLNTLFLLTSRLCGEHFYFDYFFSSTLTERDAEWIGTVASRSE